MLACISDIGYFCCNNVFSSSLKSFFSTFSFSTMVHIIFAREISIFVKQCRGWFDVSGTYRFGSVGLLLLI